MQKEVVGPFEVRALSVGEGLPLVALLSEGDMGKFQTELILASVTRDGQRIATDEFAAIVPHLGELVTKAMALNGFSTKSD